MRQCRPASIFLAVTTLLSIGSAGAAGREPSPEKAQTPTLRFYYPKDGGTVFSLPHVLLIFDVKKALFNPDRISLEIDGRPVPKDAVQGCAICAGPRPALLASRVPWALIDGQHKAALIVRPPGGKEIRHEITYTVDTSVPAASGLSGFIDFPDAHVAVSRSFRGGFVDEGFHEHDINLWLVATRILQKKSTSSGFAPVEAGVTTKFPNQGSDRIQYSLKMALKEQTQRSPAVSVGFREDDPFAVVGWHRNPSTFNVAAGVGGRTLPRGFIGASWGPEIFRAMVEYGSGGKLDYGLVLYHPYGLRAGIYHVEKSAADHRWVLQCSASLAF